MGKYNFSASRFNPLKGYHEILEVTGCDSFDEARKVVEKAVYDRELFEKENMPKGSTFTPSAGLNRGPMPTAPASAQQNAPSGAVSTTPKVSGNPSGQVA